MLYGKALLLHLPQISKPLICSCFLNNASHKINAEPKRKKPVKTCAMQSNITRKSFLVHSRLICVHYCATTAKQFLELEHNLTVLHQNP